MLRHLAKITAPASVADMIVDRAGERRHYLKERRPARNVETEFPQSIGELGLSRGLRDLRQ